MNNKIAITVDSTFDLSPELVERFDIKAIIPLYVSLGEDSYKDGHGIDNAQLEKYFNENKELPKTSAATPYDFETEFRKLHDEGYDIVHFDIGDGFSSTYRNACIAAQQVGNVWVVNTKSLSSGVGMLASIASDLAKAGKSAEEIFRICNETTSKVDISFCIDTLTYLHKGGRCSGVARLGANLLNLKPCIEVKDGGMVVGKKYRGNIEKILPTYIKDRLEGKTNINTNRILITHTMKDEKFVETLVDEIRKYQDFDEIYITKAGSTIFTHCGANTLGIIFTTN